MVGTESDPICNGSLPHAGSVHEPSIYQYLEYRAFLRDRFRWLQSQDPSFSQRKLARLAGFANPGFFNEVIQGRRKLSPAAVERMSIGLSLEPGEADYLRGLVSYTEAKDAAEKDSAMQKLEFRRHRRFFRRLSQSQSRYYLDFNYPLVRASIEACDFRGDYQMLGDFIRPPLQAASVKRYVRDLCEWGLVEQDRDGRYHVTHSFLEPPEEMKEALVRLQQAWLTQSIPLLNSVPASERHASSALITVSEQTFKSILKVVDKMREEVLDLVRADDSSERVVQFNIQVLPRGGGKRVRTLPPGMGKPAPAAPAMPKASSCAGPGVSRGGPVPSSSINRDDPCARRAADPVPPSRTPGV